MSSHSPYPTVKKKKNVALIFVGTKGEFEIFETKDMMLYRGL
jgi:hypothetical protein